jgi:hypothetical protein
MTVESLEREHQPRQFALTIAVRSGWLCGLEPVA